MSNDENYPEDFSAPAIAAPGIDVNDIDRAERFIAFLDGKARYVPQYKKWFMWDGARWQQDEDGAGIVQEAIAFVKSRLEAANEIEEPKAKQKAWMTAKLAGSNAAMNAMIDVTSSYPDICTHETKFDSDPYLFGVDNGVVDLKTGIFRSASQEDLIWKRSPVAYDKDAKYPMWIAFLEQILPDKDVRAFLQRAAGYSLTAVTVEQTLFFLYGSGANGKSTFIDTLEKLMGEYSWRTNAKLFLDDRFGGDPANLMASLPERRLVVGAEVGDAPLCETRIKDLTGGDTLNACRKYCEAFTFKPTHKLWFYGNDRPTVRNSDEGIWRRMCLLPFEVQIPEAQRDRGIINRLWSEAPGILNWMIEGCLAWQKQGLQKPEAVRAATAEYRESEDSIGEFLDEQCEIKSDGFTRTGALYSAYGLWCDSRGIPKNRQFGEKKIAARLRHAGAASGKQKVSGVQFRGWKGVSLRDPSSFLRKT